MRIFMNILAWENILCFSLKLLHCCSKMKNNDLNFREEKIAGIYTSIPIFYMHIDSLFQDILTAFKTINDGY